jgi:hypothetical protein
VGVEEGVAGVEEGVAGVEEGVAGVEEGVSLGVAGTRVAHACCMLHPVCILTLTLLTSCAADQGPSNLRPDPRARASRWRSKHTHTHTHMLGPRLDPRPFARILLRGAKMKVYGPERAQAKGLVPA